MSETKATGTAKAKGETLGADSKEGDVRMSNIIAAKGWDGSEVCVMCRCGRRDSNESGTPWHGQDDSGGKGRGIDHKRRSYDSRTNSSRSGWISVIGRCCTRPPACWWSCRRRRTLRLETAPRRSSFWLARCWTRARSFWARESTRRRLPTRSSAAQQRRRRSCVTWRFPWRWKTATASSARRRRRCPPRWSATTHRFWRPSRWTRCCA